jgi:nucleotide-binding universal stress UspA family protein
VWLFLIVAVAAVFLIWQGLNYRAASRTLPPGMTMAGLPVEGMTREQALNALEVSFATPLELVYAGEPISLFPDTVELRYDAAETADNLDQALAERSGVDGFIAYVLRRQPEVVPVPVAVDYSPERLDGFLARVAQENDQPAEEPVPDLETLAFAAGQPGYALDGDASRQRVAAALVSAAEHQVELVVLTTPTLPQGGTALEQMIQALLESRSGLVAGVFIKNLETGDELAINDDVAFDGLSVVKIAILVETYRVRDLPLAPEVSAWVSDTIGIADGAPTANQLLASVLDDGDSYEGAQVLNLSMKYLGLVNTFISTPFGDDRAFVRVATPANSRRDVTTNADLRMQTTPKDIGLLLEMLYQCSEGGGSLMVAFPGDFSAEECAQVLGWMSSSRTESLIEAGVPEDTRVAHKQGFSNDTHADAGLVFSPAVDYVLIVFLYRPEYLAYEESAPLITDIAQAAYNYFNYAVGP